MKQNRNKPNAGNNIRTSFCKILQKTDYTSDKICDPNARRSFNLCTKRIVLKFSHNEKLPKSIMFFIQEKVFSKSITAGHRNSGKRRGTNKVYRTNKFVVFGLRT